MDRDSLSKPRSVSLLRVTFVSNGIPIEQEIPPGSGQTRNNSPSRTKLDQVGAIKNKEFLLSCGAVQGDDR